MKRFAIALLAALCITGASGAKKAKKPSPDDYRPLPAMYDGSMALLDTLGYESLALPDSLRPVFIDYVARHGARYMSSHKKTETLEHVIRVAAERGVLSPEGVAFGEFLQRLDSLSKGNWGLLSPEGKAEQRFLGRWLLREFPGLVGKGNVSAISSYVPRVVQTMYGLTETIVTTDPQERDVAISASEGKEYDSLVRFFESDKQYEEYLDKGEWTPIYAEWMRENVPAAPAARLFTEGSGLREDILRTLTMHIYAVLQSLRCSGLGVPTTRWMTEEEYRRCWETENLDKYLRRTWTSVSDEPARAVTPLLVYLIRGLEDAVATGDKTPADRATARMVFGHAETLMPLFSVMNVPGCSALVNDYKEVSAKWKDYEVVPMGANMTIALLRSVKGRYYIAVCLNGKWVEPLRDGRRIVPYEAARNYWIQRAQGARK